MSRVFPTVEAAIEDAARRIGKLVGAWPYQDAHGREVMRKVRFEKPDGGKEYRPFHPAKGGWKAGDPSGLLPLYHLPELNRDQPVWVCEGEKAADAARAIGLNATTSAHGAKAAEKSDWTLLAGREVNILPDNDEAGRDYARDVARILLELDPTTRVRIVPLPGLLEAGDIVEFIEAFAKDSIEPEMIRQSILARASTVRFMDPTEVVGGPVLICLADVDAEPIDWLWPGRIALGKLSLLCGDPGLGKSFVTLDMAARVTTGSPWPDGSDCPIGSVILISAEDGLADTIVPRLNAACADVRKVIALDAVRLCDDKGKFIEKGFTLADIPNLARALRRCPDCKLVVIDPVSAYMGDTDSYKNTEVRGLLAPLAKLAADHGVAVVLVTHLNKGEGAKAAYRATGSIAFIAACRSGYVVLKDKDHPRRRLVLPIKNNIGNDETGLAYSIVGDPPAVSWEKDPVTLNADDVMSGEGQADGTPGPEPEARNAAESWLGELLADGPVLSKRVEEEAKVAGLFWRTVRRAADEMGVIREKCQYSGQYQWRLPKPPPSEDAQSA